MPFFQRHLKLLKRWLVPVWCTESNTLSDSDQSYWCWKTSKIHGRNMRVWDTHCVLNRWEAFSTNENLGYHLVIVRLVEDSVLATSDAEHRHQIFWMHIFKKNLLPNWIREECEECSPTEIHTPSGHFESVAGSIDPLWRHFFGGNFLLFQTSLIFWVASCKRKIMVQRLMQTGTFVRFYYYIFGVL